MATARDNCDCCWPSKKKTEEYHLEKKIPWKGSGKIEPNHLPKKARISLNVCKLEDVSSTNTTKILIMIIMKSRKNDANFRPAMLITLHTSTQGHFYYHCILGRYTILG